MRDLAWQVFQAGSPVLLALLGWLSVRAAAWIRASTQNAYAQGVLLRLNDAVMVAVREVQQTMVEQLKASEGGKLTATAQDNAKLAAISTIKDHFGVKGLQELATIFGVEGAAALDSLLGKRVEAAVGALKAGAVPSRQP